MTTWTQDPRELGCTCTWDEIEGAEGIVRLDPRCPYHEAHEVPESHKPFNFYTGQQVKITYMETPATISDPCSSSTYRTCDAIFLRCVCEPNMAERDHPEDEIFDIKLVFQVEEWVDGVHVPFGDIDTSHEQTREVTLGLMDLSRVAVSL